VKVIDGQAQSHYKMALHFQRRKKHKLAIEELKKAVQLNPSFANAYNAMGISYDNLRRYSQAIGCYQSALKLDPKLDYVYNNLGYSYLLKNELDAAIVAFEKAIELNDNNKRYRNNLGLAYVMKDQYDKAYEQFKIHQYLAKDSNLGSARKKSERKTPVVIRRKIKNNELQPLIKADASDQKQKDQEIKDTQFSHSDKNAFLPPGKNKAPLDQTETSTGYNRVASAKNRGVTDSKKAESLESIEKEGYHELQTESKQFDQPAHCEFCEDETAESDNAAIGINQIQIIPAENQKPSNIRKKPSAEAKADVYKAEESSVSSDPVYHISAAELVPDPTFEKNVSTESAETKLLANESANRVQNTVEAKVIEVQESYYQDSKEIVTVTPARSKKTKTDLIETNKTVSEEKQPSAYTEAVSTITSTDKKIHEKRIQNKRSQREETLSLAAKEKDLEENPKSDDIIVEVEIEIANGNGVNGAAGRFGRYLKSRGFKVAKVTNANSFDHATTKIFYCNGDVKNVYKLLQKIPLLPDQRSIIELKNMGSRIKIIIGKDLVKHDKIISSAIYKKRKS
jgi:Flp pilus assembly protein TadD